MTKDSKIVDAADTVYSARSDAKKLLGKPVDSDGDILDKNGKSRQEIDDIPAPVEPPTP